MPHGKKNVSQQGTRKLKKGLHQSRLEGEKNQAERQTMEAAMKEKDTLMEQLRARLTKRDEELKQVRDIALEFEGFIRILQTKKDEMQSVASDKVNLMFRLEKENSTFKREMKEKDECITAKVC